MAVAAGPDLTLDALLMFGAIGYTWEHDMHLYWRRATSLAASLGPTTQWERSAGELSRTLKRSTAIHLGDVDQFRAGIAELLDRAAKLRNETPTDDRRAPASRTVRSATCSPTPDWSPAPAAALGLGATPVQQVDHHRGVRQAARGDPAVAEHRGMDPADHPGPGHRRATRTLRRADVARGPSAGASCSASRAPGPTWRR